MLRPCSKLWFPHSLRRKSRAWLVDSAQEIAVDGKAERDCGDAPEATWRKLDTAAAIEKLLDTALSAKVRIMSVEPDSELAEFELELELENTGRRAWQFHLDVVATSPSGVLMELLPTQVNPGSGLVTVGALQTVPVPVSFKPSEPGTWVVRATVSRGMIDDGRQSLDCSAPDSVRKCFDEVVLEVSIDPPAVPTPAPRPTPTPSVSAGWAHTCAVDADGSVGCWGDNAEGQASPPGGEFISVSAGWEHTCGIRTDGSVVCWGLNDKYQASPPGGEFISVSAGHAHSCGVRTNGSIECWGEGRALQPHPVTWRHIHVRQRDPVLLMRRDERRPNRMLGPRHDLR